MTRYGLRLERASSTVRSWIVALCVSTLLGLAVIPTHAATFTPGCTAGVGDAAALHSAITTAGGNGQADTITLAAGCTYTLTAPLTYTGDGGALLTVQGSGAVIDGSATFRVFTFNATSDVVVHGVTIANGSSSFGGGIYNGGTLTIRDGSFTGNQATTFGGGIYNDGTLRVYDSSFTNNTATGTALGGGIYNAATGFTAIADSAFSDNAAFQGGAVHNAAGVLNIETSSFNGNIAADLGGALRNAGSQGWLIVNRSLFDQNEAGSNGGAFYNSVGQASLAHSTFTGNQAANGGAIYLFSATVITLRNNTIFGNSVTGSGGGIANAAVPFTPTLHHNIIAGNTAASGPDISGAIRSEGYNLIGSSSGVTGTVASDRTNAAAAPLNLGPLANNGGPTRTFALLPGSVAIDSGDPAYTAAEFDQRWIGYPRVANSRIDIGAFEVQMPCPSFPVAIANGDSAALINAIHCANRTPSDETIALAASGGYALTTQQYSSIDGANNGNGLPMIQSAAEGGALTINGNGAIVARSSGAPTFRILEVGTGAVLTLNNLTLADGGFNVGGFGGGLYNGGTLTLSGSTLTGNRAFLGGGLYNDGTLTITGSSFANNTATNNGGGLMTGATAMTTIATSTFSENTALILGGGLVNSGQMTITSSTFQGNDTTGATSTGGGISNAAQATLTLDSSTVTANSSSQSSGGIYNAGTLIINSSTLSGNLAQQDGGAIYNISTATLSSSTLVNNSVSGYGGAVFNTGLMTVTHSTLHGNTAGLDGGGIVGNLSLGHTIVAGNNAILGSADDMNGAVTSLGYNLIGNSASTTGLAPTDRANAAAAPLNLAPLANNGGPTQTLALLPGSVAINSGNPAFVAPPQFDQRGSGHPRVRAGRIDIGAYEAPGASSLTLQLTLQGRPTAPDSAYLTTVHVQVRPAGGGAAIINGDYPSNSSGQVSIPDLPTGTYTLWVKGTHTLANVQSVTLAAGANNATTATLKEGDADDSNTVTIADFAILAASFGRASGQAGYDARADFNGSGTVTIADFSLLAAQFGQSGAH